MTSNSGWIRNSANSQNVWVPYYQCMGPLLSVKKITDTRCHISIFGSFNALHIFTKSLSVFCQISKLLIYFHANAVYYLHLQFTETLIQCIIIDTLEKRTMSLLHNSSKSIYFSSTESNFPTILMSNDLPEIATIGALRMLLRITSNDVNNWYLPRNLSIWNFLTLTFVQIWKCDIESLYGLILEQLRTGRNQPKQFLILIPFSIIFAWKKELGNVVLLL